MPSITYDIPKNMKNFCDKFRHTIEVFPNSIKQAFPFHK